MTWTFFVSGCTRRRPLSRATTSFGKPLRSRPGRPLARSSFVRERHSQNSRALRGTLQGERYRNLLASLAAAIECPALKDDAWEPCRNALPPLAAAAWRKLKKGGRDLEAASPDADFHQVRKLAKAPATPPS